jgi:L-ascorbate metabolism protein UlaG (beta-lactamase superfamily)
VLLQIDDKFILTDPVFTETVGMVSRRTVAPGLLPDALPEIDAVLISHMHFDHLSLGSLDLIKEKTAEIIVPYGGLAYVPRSHVPPVELDTWETVELDGLRISAAPVEHPGWRFGGDRAWRTTAAAAYVIEYKGKTVYFGGDTARSTWMFRSVRRRFGAIDLALLPIAPINPRDFMCRVHMDPSEALDAFVDLGADQMMPIHYDTFRNSLDEPGEAPRLLRESMASRKLDPARVAVFSQGQRRVFIP